MVLGRLPKQAPALLALVRLILRGQFRGRLASKSIVSLSHQRFKDPEGYRRFLQELMQTGSSEKSFLESSGLENLG